MSFVIYSKNGCPYCDKIKQVMHLAELNHVVYTLDVDFSRDQFYSEFGDGSTFPQVKLDENNIGGCTDTIRYLKEQNIV